MREYKKYHNLPYNKELKKYATELRKAGNLSEVLLWQQINRGQFNNLDFDRQKIIGNYIVDFFCALKGVVIEIDGESHDEKAEYDAKRDEFLEGLGLTVIRLLDIDVKRDLDSVMKYLALHEAFVD